MGRAKAVMGDTCAFGAKALDMDKAQATTRSKAMDLLMVNVTGMIADLFDNVKVSCAAHKGSLCHVTRGER